MSIQIADLPHLKDLTVEQLKELFGAGRFRPGVEGLEDRLARSGMGLSNGVLTVAGSDYQEVAKVYFNNNNVVVDLYSANNAGTVIDRLNPQAGPNVTRMVRAFDQGQASTAVAKIVFQGFAGDDYFLNLTAKDTEAFGGKGKDALYGGSGSNVLWGDGDDDYLVGGQNLNSIHGGLGSDTILGGGATDFLYGDDGRDKINGVGGNDVIWGGRGTDVLRGASGQDVLYGEEDVDLLYGGTERDYLYAGAGGAAIDMNWVDGSYGSISNNLVYGEDGDDLLYGGNDPDELFGGKGNDCLWGYGGDDYLFGQEGSDTLWGGDGNDNMYGDNDARFGVSDVLYGEKGDDWLFGYGGADSLYGGAGNDLLNAGEMDGVKDLVVGGEGLDTFVRYYFQRWNGRDFAWTLDQENTDYDSSSDTTVSFLLNNV